VHHTGGAATVTTVSMEMWDWWENRLTREQRAELISLGGETLPVELALEIHSTAGTLLLLEAVRDAATAAAQWRLSGTAARFVGDRRYELTHDETRARRRPDPVIVAPRTPNRPSHVELLYTPSCPDWEATAIRLSIALQVTGREDVQVHVRRITTAAEAEETAFTGSPMIRFDGVDPFDEPGLTVGLTCRLYRAGTDVIGGPTIPMLVDALAAAQRDPTSRT
jgi:hypothetical protein